jgi:electron transfer flavoprotein beta subunit
MKALVGLKRVVDYTAQKIKIKNNEVDLANTRMYINPFCEIAIQEAVNLKAKKSISEITALSIGPLALGADKAIYVNSDLRHDRELQPLIVAKTLKHFVERDGIELVILGKQCIHLVMFSC